jgi:hypothetical protein
LAVSHKSSKKQIGFYSKIPAKKNHCNVSLKSNAKIWNAFRFYWQRLFFLEYHKPADSKRFQHAHFSLEKMVFNFQPPFDEINDL